MDLGDLFGTRRKLVLSFLHSYWSNMSSSTANWTRGLEDVLDVTTIPVPRSKRETPPTFLQLTWAA